MEVKTQPKSPVRKIQSQISEKTVMLVFLSLTKTKRNELL